MCKQRGLAIVALFVACISGWTEEGSGNSGIEVNQKMLPILKNQQYNEVLHLYVPGTEEKSEVTAFYFEIKDGSCAMVEAVQVFSAATDSKKSKRILFGETNPSGKTFRVEGCFAVGKGGRHFFVSVQVAAHVGLRDLFSLDCKAVGLGGKKVELPGLKNLRPLRLGIALRQANDDGVHTYRIPGLATTTNGTLIAVYDIRRDSRLDLQADIDVGMSRSTDGCATWEPMKVIMDMKEWGGLPENQNGIGDPSVLVDRENNTVWVAALWAHGKPDERVIQASEPGLDPKRSAQWMLVKSEDEGKSWSKPVNITKQVKNPKWKIVFQGPGKGICMENGTLVFPAQFWDGNNVSFSTIVWSKDHGASWHCGTGAKSNTTEAQVIELDDGNLMLNMRDNRNRKDKSDSNGRAVAVTSDLGKTWSEHPASRGALREPVCMASLIKGEFVVDGERRSLVLFSNPNSKFKRDHLTLKASLDDAQSWSTGFSILLDEESGWGYSCMTQIDDQTVGILYEGSKAHLVFQAVRVEDLFE